MEDRVRVVLPEGYDLVVGDTFQLFYRGLVEAVNPYNYDILAVCEKGRNYPRYFEFTPEEEGVYPLVIRVFANDKTLLAAGKTLLRVCRAKAAPKKEVNILCIGDSLTVSGEWVHEAYRRLTATGGEPEGLGFSGFRFIGTCLKGKAGFEGYGGWKWDDYLGYTRNAVWVVCRHNKSEQDQHSVWKDAVGGSWSLETIEQYRLKFVCVDAQTKPEADTVLTHCANGRNTESIWVTDSYKEYGNPFWDEKKQSVDFKSYCRRHHYDRIDAAYIMLTWNGSPRLDNLRAYSLELAAKGKQLMDILHNQYPDAKVRIMGLQAPSVNGGCGASYGARLPYCDAYGMVRYVMELNKVYQEWAQEEKYRDYVEFIHISGQFDSEYNMPREEKCVNTRNHLKETVGSNGCHPLHAGYLQIGDAVYRNLIKSFCCEETG